MPNQPLFEVPIFLSLCMLAAMFSSVIFPFFLTSRFLPQLTEDSHSQTSWLDGLRGIAAAVVALNHAPLVIINLQLVPKVFIFTKQEFDLFNFFGSIGVQIFFCITGLLFGRKILFSDTVDWTNFYKKRLRRVVPAYFFSCALALVVFVWCSWPVTQPFSEIIRGLPSIFSFGLIPLPSLNGFDFGRLLGVNWSLAIEWRFYAALPIIFILLEKSPRIGILIITAFAAGDSLITQSASWVFFVSGAACSPLMYRRFGQAPRILATSCIIMAALLFVRYWNIFPPYGYQRWALVSTLFIATTIAKPKLLTIKPLISIGTVSYSFYLLHCLTLFLVMRSIHLYVMDITTISVRPFTIIAGATLSFAAIVATLSYIYIERPFMRISSHKKGAPSISTKNQSLTAPL